MENKPENKEEKDINQMLLENSLRQTKYLMNIKDWLTFFGVITIFYMIVSFFTAIANL